MSAGIPPQTVYHRVEIIPAVLRPPQERLSIDTNPSYQTRIPGIVIGHDEIDG